MSDRPVDVLRTLRITPDYTDAPLASVLIECGQTRSLPSMEIRCLVFVGFWWLANGEYSMLQAQLSTKPGRKRKLDGRATGFNDSLDVPRWFDWITGPCSLWIVRCMADGGTRSIHYRRYVAARLAIERLARVKLPKHSSAQSLRSVLVC